MLVKVIAIIETVVEIDSKDETQKDEIVAQAKAKSLVEEDWFSILRFDLGNSLQQDVSLGTSIIRSKNDLPRKWSNLVPWSDYGTVETCKHLLQESDVVFQSHWWENCTSRQSQTVYADLCNFEKAGRWTKKVPVWCQQLAEHYEVETGHHVIFQKAWQVIAKCLMEEENES